MIKGKVLLRLEPEEYPFGANEKTEITIDSVNLSSLYKGLEISDTPDKMLASIKVIFGANNFNVDDIWVTDVHSDNNNPLIDYAINNYWYWVNYAQFWEDMDALQNVEYIRQSNLVYFHNTGLTLSANVVRDTINEVAYQTFSEALSDFENTEFVEGGYDDLAKWYYRDYDYDEVFEDYINWSAMGEDLVNSLDNVYETDTGFLVSEQW